MKTQLNIEPLQQVNCCDVSIESGSSNEKQEEKIMLKDQTPFKEIFYQPSVRLQLENNSYKNQSHKLQGIKLDQLKTAKKSTIKQLIDKTEAQSVKTLKQEFMPRVNPHHLKRAKQKQEGFVWFAAYDSHVSSSNMRQDLQTLQIPFPEEMFQLQVKDFQLSFATPPQQQINKRNNHTGAKSQNLVFPCVEFCENRVLLVRVYLMQRVDFEKFVMNQTQGKDFKLPQKVKFSESITVPFGCQLSLQNQEAQIPIYNSITKLCQLESLDVFCLNATMLQYQYQKGGRDQLMKTKRVQPSIDALKNLFGVYQKAWKNTFTEHFLLYYLYENPNIQPYVSYKDLIQITAPQLLVKQQQMKQEQDTIALSQDELSEPRNSLEAENQNQEQCLSNVDSNGSYVTQKLVSPTQENKKFQLESQLLDTKPFTETRNKKGSVDQKTQHQCRSHRMTNEKLKEAADMSFGLGGRIVARADLLAQPQNHNNTSSGMMFGESRNSVQQQVKKGPGLKLQNLSDAQVSQFSEISEFVGNGSGGFTLNQSAMSLSGLNVGFQFGDQLSSNKKKKKFVPL